jgi:hypothetical protein
MKTHNMDAVHSGPDLTWTNFVSVHQLQWESFIRTGGGLQPPKNLKSLKCMY